MFTGRVFAASLARTRWSIAGAAAGLTMIASMLVLRVVTGVPILPELFEDQVIALLPGSLFSLVLDRLQFAAKPLLFVSLALVPVPVGAALGWIFGRTWRCRGRLSQHTLAGGSAYGLILFVGLALAVTLSGDGATAARGSAGVLLVGALVFGISLVGFARLLSTQSDETHPGERGIDRARRIVVFGGLVGGAMALGGGALARMLATNAEQPAVASDGSVTSTSVSIPPGVADAITPNERFYVVSKNFNDPRVAADKWSLEVLGLVQQPRQFSYEDILALPTVSQYTTLECISNPLGGNLMSNAYWTGVQLSDLFARVGLQATARTVIIRSADNYYESFPLALVSAPGVLLAHTMNGVPLPDKHGFPLRLILPGRYGMKNPKWITKIELAADPIDGYWARRGWDREALVQTAARLDTPTDNVSIIRPRLRVGGVAFAGSRGISRVEASLDSGAIWRDARAAPPLGSSTWVQWAVDWEGVGPGSYRVLARATDGAGTLQAPEETGAFPAGARGYHGARIDVLPA